LADIYLIFDRISFFPVIKESSGVDDWFFFFAFSDNKKYNPFFYGKNA